jgi:hypothetical protein
LIRLGPDAKARGRAALEFLNREEEQRIVIGINNNDDPYISLTDSGADDQLVIDVASGQGSAIAFRNRSSRSGVLLTSGPPGVSALGLMDKDGNRLVEMGLNPDGSARLTFRSTEGRKLFQAP